jgi:F0F1-type ATP synthase membrane subunit b/b'
MLDITNTTKKLTKDILVFVTIFCVTGFIIIMIFKNIINVIRKYNSKVSELNNNKTLDNTNLELDDYIYDNDDEIINTKNLNKEIIKSLKNNNENIKSELAGRTRLLNQLNINSNVTSQINNKALSQKYDDSKYNQKTPSFWSKLLYL